MNLKFSLFVIKNMRLNYVFVLLSFFIFGGQYAGAAMECWRCENAKDNAECLRKGRKETCRELNSVCAVEVRLANDLTRITKRCKQNVACQNNEKQMRLRDEFRRCIGGIHRQEQYCYCCCEGDACNESALDCLPQPPPTQRTPPKPTPKCMPLEAPLFGQMNCLNNRSVGSRCSFSCDDPMDEVQPSAAKETTCLPTQRWSQEPPCCMRKCPPAAKMDIAIILDSSTSIREENWEIGKKFVEAILRVFKVGRDATRYAIYRFNTDVDEETLINFNSYYNQTALFEGTLTGKALKYLKSQVLKRDKGCRMDDSIPTAVLLFTDGKSRDNTGPIAKSLRQTCNVITIWVKNKEIKRVVKREVGNDTSEEDAKKTERQLKRISGRRNQNNFFTFESFSELKKEVVEVLEAHHHEEDNQDFSNVFPEPKGTLSEDYFFEEESRFSHAHVGAHHRSYDNDKLSRIEHYDGTTRDILNRLKEIGCRRRECRAS